MATPRVAIVHDWMLLGGAEKVVEQLLLMYPDAPLYTSAISAEWDAKLAGHDVITGYLDSWLFKKIRKFVPFLRQWWFGTLDFSYYDIVISSSGAEAKGIKVPKGVLHINYCHAPTHYYWGRVDEYLKNPGLGMLNPVARFGLKLLLKPMRAWDLKAAYRPNFMVANSRHTAAEIKKYYGRDAVVVHPPVDVERFTKKSDTPRVSYVTAGRQVPYKKIDLGVQAVSQLNLPLTVAGDGPDHQKLVDMAGPSVSFNTKVSDVRMARYFQEAKGFLFPGVDDFGITAVEAMAAGAPVLAYQAGGALDYVVPGKTGLFFDAQTPEAVAECLKRAEKIEWNEKSIAKKAAEFSPSLFRKRMQEVIDTSSVSFLEKQAEKKPDQLQ